jgi:hypothetical protein
MPQNCSFQSSFTQTTAQLTQEIPQIPQFTHRHHGRIISPSTSVSSSSFSWWAMCDIFLFEFHFLIHILRFLVFFSDKIMADVASKQQTTALFLSTIVTRTRWHTDLTKPDGKPVLCQRKFISVFVQFFTHLTARFNLECMGPLIHFRLYLYSWILTKAVSIPKAEWTMNKLRNIITWQYIRRLISVMFNPWKVSWVSKAMLLCLWVLCTQY